MLAGLDAIRVRDEVIALDPRLGEVLAAADVYHALGEPRPHRAPVSASAAAEVLAGETRAGRPGGRRRAGRGRAAGAPGLPGASGLTAREAEVLVQLARGLSNAAIAAALTVSRKTMSTHLEHIYAKLGVSTRTQAALFAMRHGFIGWLPDESGGRRP